MGSSSPVWLGLAVLLFGSGGVGATWLLTRTQGKVEGIKNTTSANSVALDGFNALAQRQNDEIARKDTYIAVLEKRVAVLEAEVVRLMRQEKP